jgi:hypothetical protein
MYNSIELPFLFFEKDGKEYLGIDIGPTGNLSRNIALALDKTNGFLIHSDGQIETWPVEGVSTQNQRLVVRGIKPEGVRTIHEDLTDLSSILKSLILLHDAGYQYGNQYTPLLFLPCQKGMLILPEKLGDVLIANLTPDLREQWVETYRYPASKPLDRFQFGFACHLFQVVTGSAPFPERVGLPREWARLRGALIPQASLGFDFNPVLGRLIENILKHQIFPSQITDWRKALEVLESGQASVPASPESKMKAQRSEKLTYQTARFSVWWQRHWARVAITAGILIFAALIPGNLLIKALEPPKTINQNPRVVVESFYQAIASFDSEYLEDAIINSQSQRLVLESQSIMLNARVREGAERRRLIASALEWQESGANSVPKDFFIYGASNVRIKTIEYDFKVPSYTFRVQYDWYNTMLTAPEQTESAYLPIAEKREDIVTIAWNERAWQINKIKSNLY